jgi:hypothetical protein
VKPTVFVVDDDAAVRDSLRMLLKSVGLPVEVFESAQEFLLLGDCFLDSAVMEPLALLAQTELFHEVQFNAEVVRRLMNRFIGHEPGLSVRASRLQNRISHALLSRVKTLIGRFQIFMARPTKHLCPVYR